jgi:elongation of very long chain fatty acids protein 6
LLQSLLFHSRQQQQQNKTNATSNDIYQIDFFVSGREDLLTMEVLNNFIEEHTDWRSWAAWMSDHYSVAYGICAAYVVVIFGIQWLMKDEKIKGFELRKPLIIWNILLAAFSIIGALNVVPAHFATLMTHGLAADMCTTTSEIANPWVCLFCLSKIPELIDTLFLVLRKRPVIFLHWYHHIATLLYCWDAWAIQIPNGGWFALMNLVIHSIMYSYFAMTAYGVRFSNPTRLMITALQISQMFFGLLIVGHNLVAIAGMRGLSKFPMVAGLPS